MQSNIIDQIDAIRHCLQECEARPLQEVSRWVDGIHVCRRDTSVGARALS